MSLDRYEAEAIAEAAAQQAANDLRHELEYGELERLRDRVATLEQRLTQRAAEYGELTGDLWRAIEDLRADSASDPPSS